MDGWPVQSHSLPCSEELCAWRNALVSPSLLLSTTIFILWFCQWSPRGQWRMSTDACSLHTDHFQLPCSQIAFSVPHKWNVPVDPQWSESSRASMLYLWPSKWRCWQSQKTTTSFHFQLRKKAMVAWETLKTEKPCHVLSYLCKFPVLTNHLRWKW